MQHENVLILIGRVGNTPEFKNHNGTKVTKFTLATTRKWKDKDSGEIKEKTIWHNIVCFGAQADYARDYVVKGAECYVNGEQDNYVFVKDDDTKVYGSQVNASKVSANRFEKKASGDDQNNQPQDQPPIPEEFPNNP